MTLEARAKLIADFYGSDHYDFALRMLREAIDEALGKTGDEPTHLEWTGAK